MTTARPQKIEIFNLTKRADRKKPWTVKWRVDGKDGYRAFVHKTVAERFRSELDRAVRSGEVFDPVTKLPTSWQLADTPNIALWCKRYMEKNLVSYAPRSRKTIGDDLVPLIVRSVSEEAPALGADEFRSLFDWLAGKEELPSTVVAWLNKWSPKLHELDKSALNRLVDRLRLRVDMKTPLSTGTSTKRLVNVKMVLNKAVSEGVIAPLEWPPKKAGPRADRSESARVWRPL
jgi:hypothetical protein